jgi:hypothetical protein
MGEWVDERGEERGVRNKGEGKRQEKKTAYSG